MPSCKQIAGQILDNENLEVLKQLKVELQGKYAVMTSDGWKDDSQNSVSSVNLSVGGKVCYHPLPQPREDLQFAHATDISYRPYLSHGTPKEWGVNVHGIPKND